MFHKFFNRDRYEGDYTVADFLNEDDNEINDEFENVDCTNLRLEQKHINRMRQYYNKLSDPVKLVQDIQNPAKLVSRWLAARAIGWVEAEELFKDAILDRGILNVEQLEKYNKIFSNGKIMRRYDTDLKTITNSDRIFKKSLAYLYNYVVRLHIKFKYRSLGSPVYDYSINQQRKHANYIVNGHELTIGETVINFDTIIVKTERGSTTSYVFEDTKLNLAKFKKKIEELCE